VTKADPSPPSFFRGTHSGFWSLKAWRGGRVFIPNSSCLHTAFTELAHSGVMEPPPYPMLRTRFDRRNAVTLKLLFIAGLVLLLQAPLHLVNNLESYALLAGMGALFVAVAAIMFFTRHVDWHAQDVGTATAAEGAK
jgi:hypothetical protein